MSSISLGTAEISNLCDGGFLTPRTQGATRVDEEMDLEAVGACISRRWMSKMTRSSEDVEVPF